MNGLAAQQPLPLGWPPICVSLAFTVCETYEIFKILYFSDRGAAMGLIEWLVELFLRVIVFGLIQAWLELIFFLSNDRWPLALALHLTITTGLLLLLGLRDGRILALLALINGVLVLVEHWRRRRKQQRPGPGWDFWRDEK